MHGRISPRVLIGVAVVVIVGFAAAYFLLFGDDSPPPLTLGAAPSTVAGEAAATTDVAGVWTVASGSEAGYRVREQLVGLSAPGDAVGRTPAVSGQVQVSQAGDGIVASDARFEVDLRELKSDKDRRDTFIKTQGLESNQFPMATFVATEPVRLSDEPPVGQVVKVTSVGDLTLHGVTKRVSIPIDARLAGNQIELVGSLKFPMSDFDIEPPRAASVVSIESDATLEFRLLLQKG
ncbi:MAG: YceI family protein [Acidimicrobiales bacterium]